MRSAIIYADVRINPADYANATVRVAGIRREWTLQADHENTDKWAVELRSGDTVHEFTVDTLSQIWQRVQDVLTTEERT